MERRKPRVWFASFSFHHAFSGSEKGVNYDGSWDAACAYKSVLVLLGPNHPASLDCNEAKEPRRTRSMNRDPEPFINGRSVK